MPKERNVICPYYIAYRTKGGPWRHEIECEKIEQGEANDYKHILKFKGSKEMYEWMDMHCSTFKYEKCAYYKAIDKELDMNKKEMQKKIDNQERYIEILRKERMKEKQKNHELEEKISSASRWINALAAQNGEEVRLKIKDFAETPEYECKYDLHQGEIIMRQKALNA